MGEEMSGDRGLDLAREWPGRERRGGRPWWFLAGLLAGSAVTFAGVWVWTKSGREAENALLEIRAAESRAAKAEEAAKLAESKPNELGADQLRARWDGLRAAFIKTAEPLMDSLDRAERLRADLPALQAKAREAEAVYVAAKTGREKSESAYSELLEGKARGGAEPESAKSTLTRSELLAQQSKVRLDGMKRDRQKAIDGLIAKGETPATAAALAGVHYDLRIKAEENQYQRMQPVLDRAQAEKDRDVRFGQPKRLAVQHADVEVRRAQEQACQAAWEKLQGDQRALETRLANAGLSPDEQRQLDQLLEIVRGPGSRPPGDGDPIEFQDFLDRFAASLDDAQPSPDKQPAKNVSGRFNTLVNRLMRAEDKPMPADLPKE